MSKTPIDIKLGIAEPTSCFWAEFFRLHFRVIDFQLAKFPGQTLAGVQTHLKHEIAEWIKKPEDKTEAADILILFLASCWRAGLTPWDIVRLAHEKMDINEKREWPTQPDSDGVFHHVEPINPEVRQ